MTQDDRTDPPYVADERPMLETWLDYQRETLAFKCQGLTDEQLRTASVPPSDLTLLGLVRHMAEVERSWFRRVLAQQQSDPIFYTTEDPDGDFHHPDDADPAADFAVWRTEIDEVRKLTADLGLDHTVTTPKGQRIQLRWIYVHMIEEYARHNGHADLIRERIDGVTGD